MSKHSKVSKGRHTITSTPSSFTLLLPSLYLSFPFLIFFSPFTSHSIPSIYFLLFTTTSSSSSSPLLHTTVTCSHALLCYTAPPFTYIPSPPLFLCCLPPSLFPFSISLLLLSGGGGVVSSLSFDHTAAFLALGTSEGTLRVTTVKDWMDVSVRLTASCSIAPYLPGQPTSSFHHNHHLSVSLHALLELYHLIITMPSSSFSLSSFFSSFLWHVTLPCVTSEYLLHF